MPRDPVPTPTAPPGAWDRRDWIALADRLLGAARRYASPGHARIAFPGPDGGYGLAVDGLEGFARTFLLAGFRIAGERGAGLDGLAEWYARGIATGTDPASPERWVRLDEHAQAKVEAASLALVLDLTRPWIWDRLSPAVRERVVDYLSPAVGDPTYPPINWVWFRLVVQTFLRSVGGPYSLDEIAEDLATHDTFAREDGWLADGPERAFDHYTGWALHLYPTLWAGMAGAADLAAERRDRDVAALDRYLLDAITLIGGDGSPLIQGRSLIYRFAAAAPFWVGALAGVPSISPGRLRRAATSIVRHFVDRGAPDTHGLLTLGWHEPWPRLAQQYSGPGSPYWASKGLLGLALPADHPVWTVEEEPLPIEERDTLRAVRAAGWLVSATRADGIVRVINHGTDHAVEGAPVGDSPLYARLGYSTATSPVLDEAAWRDPLDQSVTLVDAAGRATHRAGMRLLTVHIGEDGVGVAASTSLVRWVDPDPDQRNHGSGRTGAARPAGQVTVCSLVRGPWELRLARVDDLTDGVDETALRLRVGGWAVPVADGGPTCRLDTVHGDATAGATTIPDAGPLHHPAVVHWLEYLVRVGTWTATLIELCRRTFPENAAPARARHVARRGGHHDRSGNAHPGPPGPQPEGERMKRAIPAVLGVATALSLVLAGCGGEETPSDPNAPVTLTLAGWSLSTTPEFKTLADGFRASNPHVTIELKEYDATNYDTQMTADLAAGKAPDIYVQKNLKNFYTYQSGRQLLDVSDVAGGLGTKVGGLSAYQVDGKTYAIPYRQDSWVLYYNKELFDKAKVAYPDGSWTWAEYVTAAKNLTTGLKSAGSAATGAYQHTWQSTVQGFALAQTPGANLTGGDFSYLKPYYDRSVDLQKAGAQPNYGTVTTNKLTYQAQFGKQKSAMLLMGTWYVATLLSQRAKGDADKFAWGIAPAPQFDASTTGTKALPVTFGDPTGLGINPKIDKSKVAAAKAFLAYAAGENGAKALAGIGITPALSSDTVTSTYFGLDGVPGDDLSKFAFSTHDTKPENPVSKHTAGLQNILNEMHSTVMSNSKGVDDAIGQTQSRAKNEVLNK